MTTLCPPGNMETAQEAEDPKAVWNTHVVLMDTTISQDSIVNLSL